VVSPRPDRLVFVTATGTEIGKTWWAASLARTARAHGWHVAARKPTQSGGHPGTRDADVLAAATGEDPTVVCPPSRTYDLAWAPPMAAAELGLPPVTIVELVAGLDWAPGTDLGLVEGAGGVRSPLAVDGDNLALVEALSPDLVVVVADAGLGTINGVRLTVAALATVERPSRVVVALNRFGSDPLHARNRDVLARDGLDLVTRPEELARVLGVDQARPP
jgi:dethiobiotin synthetase